MAIEQLKCNYGRIHSFDSAKKTFRIYLIKLIEAVVIWNGRYFKWNALIEMEKFMLYWSSIGFFFSSKLLSLK